MSGGTSPQRGGVIIGLALVLLGALALVVQVSDIEVGWPIWIIGPGLAFLVGAFAVGGPGGSGMAAVGGIVTMVGIVLAVQDYYALYETWAYAWALVAPGGVGLGLTVYGLLSRRANDLRGGLGALVAGAVIFLVGFLFFEGVINLSGGRFGNFADVVVPVLVVGIGVVILVGAFVPGPWRRPYLVVHDRQDRAAAERGEASGWAAPIPETLAVPLDGASDAEVMITFGAGRLRVGTAAPGLLVDGTYQGGVKADRGGPGRIRLAPSTPPAGWGWDRAPYGWTAGLSGEVPLSLRVETGAADSELDLSGLHLTELRLRTGASETRVTLPAAAGFTRVNAEGGAAAIRFRVPDGVAARIRTFIALGSSDVDVVRFPRTADGTAWESVDYATATNRVEIEVRGGIGSVSVR